MIRRIDPVIPLTVRGTRLIASICMLNKNALTIVNNSFFIILFIKVVCKVMNLSDY
jgi:hypothetical protein